VQPVVTPRDVARSTPTVTPVPRLPTTTVKPTVRLDAPAATTRRSPTPIDLDVAPRHFDVPQRASTAARPQPNQPRKSFGPSVRVPTYVPPANRPAPRPSVRSFSPAPRNSVPDKRFQTFSAPPAVKPAAKPQVQTYKNESVKSVKASKSKK
jgi:hypothetical protein